MPDLKQYSSNTKAARMYYAPGDPMDTLLYFMNHIYTIVEKRTNVGTNRYFVCSGPYDLDPVALSVQWTQGPLRGKNELLAPVAKEKGFVLLKSRFREFWIKE